MASPSETVLVTGCNGFTGRHLRTHLRRAGYRVVGLSYNQTNNSDELQCDITSPEQLDRALASTQPDYVIHLAAISFVTHGNVQEIYQVNLFGTLNLLDAVLRTGLRPRKTIIASSANIYGNPNIEPIGEEVCPAPVNHYGASKLAMEHLVRTYRDRLDITITRPFNYTGPGQARHFLIPKIVSYFREQRRSIELGNLDVVRDFCDIRFVVDAYLELMICPAHSDVVNICSGRGIALTEIIETMNAIAGYDIEVRINPELIRRSEIKRLVGDKRRLCALIGIRPEYDIRDILQTMYQTS